MSTIIIRIFLIISIVIMIIMIMIMIITNCNIGSSLWNNGYQACLADCNDFGPHFVFRTSGLVSYEAKISKHQSNYQYEVFHHS